MEKPKHKEKILQKKKGSRPAEFFFNLFEKYSQIDP